MNLDEDLSRVEEAVKKKVNIPKRWKKQILEEFKKQALNVNDIWHIEDIVLSWDWITRDCEWIWKTIRLLNKYPASTIYLLSVNYALDNQLDTKDYGKKVARRNQDRIRNAIYKLQSAGLIYGIVMNPEECGPGIRAPTIWVSPFANEHDIERARDFYRNMGGGAKGPLKKKLPKDAKDVALHNFRVRAFSILNKWKENYKTYNYFKCPKKHDEGYIRRKKTKSKAKHRIRIPTCNQCSKNLEIISFLEFFEHKEEKLFKNWGIKK
jgi:hypothetical protein